MSYGIWIENIVFLFLDKKVTKHQTHPFISNRINTIS
jgi:hypothetical protein